jgi:hypothetical protein
MKNADGGGEKAVFIRARTRSDADGKQRRERGERAMMERNPKQKTGLEGTAWIRSMIDAIHWISFSTVLHA